MEFSIIHSLSTYSPFLDHTHIPSQCIDSTFREQVVLGLEKGHKEDLCILFYCSKQFSSCPKLVLPTQLLQARLQQYVNRELPDVSAGFRKGKGTRDQIANVGWIIKKAREFQIISTSALLTMLKPLTVWITIIKAQFSKSCPVLLIPHPLGNRGKFLSLWRMVNSMFREKRELQYLQTNE